MKLKPTISRDSDTLAALGKKQVLKRRFGFWSLLGFAVGSGHEAPFASLHKSGFLRLCSSY